jgi:hypothetical protein
MECPYIDKTIVVSRFNVPIDHEGYRYYRHDDGFGVISLVQFCKLIGRKRDVFECLNEGEWHHCYAYKSKVERENNASHPSDKGNP